MLGRWLADLSLYYAGCAECLFVTILTIVRACNANVLRSHRSVWGNLVLAKIINGNGRLKHRNLL